MDVRVGLWRRLSIEELMLLNYGVREDSWESLGLQGDPTSPFWRRSALGFLWRESWWSWNSSTLATSCEELTHWKRPWCWEELGTEGEGDDRGWDRSMASLTRWTWVWVNSKSWWWTGRPGVLQFMGSQRVGHDWKTELNWTYTHITGEENENPLQHSCLENSMDRGVWRAAAHEVTQSGTTEWLTHVCTYMGFPDGSDSKKTACYVGYLGLISGLGRSPGEGNGNPLQYSCL